MRKPDIQSREDLALLVSIFYKKICQNEKISPFFKLFIVDWSTHKERFTDFWHSNLFSSKSYQGKILQSHIHADHHFKCGFNENHFKLWLELWILSVNELFNGENAEKAKKRARCMASIMCKKVIAARELESKIAS